MVKLGINRALWVFGALQAVAILGFAWLAHAGPNPLLLAGVIVGMVFGASSLYLVLKVGMTERHNGVYRWVQDRYEGGLAWSMSHPRFVIGGACASFVLSLLVFALVGVFALIGAACSDNSSTGTTTSTQSVTTARAHDTPPGALSPPVTAVEPPPAGGLRTTDAEARLREHGSNEPAPAPRRTLWQDIVRPLASPIVLILLAASVVAAIAARTHRRPTAPRERLGTVWNTHGGGSGCTNIGGMAATNGAF